MKNIIRRTLISLFILTVTFANAFSQAPTKKPLKDFICKEWKVKSNERFGIVSTTPDTSMLLSDKMVLYSDMSFKIPKMKDTLSGTWSVDARNTYITLLVNNNPKDKRLLKIMTAEEKELLLEYQTPDLI